MENQPELLTVATLIKDLQSYDQGAEVAVMMHEIPVTLPIGFMTKAQAQYSDGTPKNYVILVVSPVAVEKALNHIKEEVNQGNNILQLN